MNPPVQTAFLAWQISNGFLGSDSIFREIRSNVSLPMLRKIFIVEEYQLYESKCMGADAILLIRAIEHRHHFPVSFHLPHIEDCHLW